MPTAYVDLVGYDEVAHHSGIGAPDALDTLRRTDDQLERLLTTLDNASRPYYVVVLADHGQTQGATFEGRYGEPLAVIGPNTADHLRRTSSFDNCPDLLINSFYDPEADEGAAFEELIGFHGGMGGQQSHPFVLAPAGLTQPTEPLVGARSIHELFKTWLGETQIERSTD